MPLSSHISFPHCVADEPLRVAGTTSSASAEFDSQSASRRLLVRSEFVIPADALRAADRDLQTVRLLRVIMERPRENLAARDTKSIWLTIELSETYRAARSVATKNCPGPPSESTTSDTCRALDASSGSWTGSNVCLSPTRPSYARWPPQPESVVSSRTFAPCIGEAQWADTNILMQTAPVHSEHSAYRTPTSSKVGQSSAWSLIGTSVEPTPSNKRRRQVSVDEDALPGHV